MTADAAGRAPSVVSEEARKLTAFLRRDFKLQWSYRVPFFFDWVNLLTQVALFWLVGRLVDQTRLPSFGGARPTYVQFVAIGIAISSFLQIGLTRVVSAIRNEQLMGTLESVLMTPTSPLTIQIGSVMYDLVYVPIRTGVFLVLVSVFLGAPFAVGGIAPVLVILLVFIPLVWGLGMVSAAGVLVFKKGSGFAGLAALALSASASTYVPVEAFPEWIQPLVRWNPLTLTLDATRSALLGTGSWEEVPRVLTVLIPVMVACLLLGVASFAAALRRERRKGSLGMY
ncbi:MAG TPA: ABC transporter permease [Acidimicrobiales bacterium]|nr:ABC transporter permease [Acidimicrobiales bacterium]